MSSLKKVLVAAMAASSLGVGGVAITAAPASAAIACNGAGECWHVDRRMHYDPALGIRFHDDGWRARQHWGAGLQWRENHAGRGYYRNGVWITF